MDAASSADRASCWTGGQDATPQPDGHGGKALTLALDRQEGAHHDFVLVLADRRCDVEPPDAERAWQGTERVARAGAASSRRRSRQRDARHAYAVLSGLTSAGGGMVAAATTSLPERAEQGRNYDYRYVWIRDQCYAGQAVAKAGPHPLMDDAVRFVTDRLLARRSASSSPPTPTTGGAVPDQRQLDLPGYPGGADIVGNWVNQQFQLDAFGEALLLFAAAARHDHLDADGWRAAEVAAAAIAQRWQEPDTDAGIWELDPDAWTHSRLICAAGLRADRRSADPPASRRRAGSRLADAIVSDTAEHALHQSGRWQRSPDDPTRRRRAAAARDPRRDPGVDPRSSRPCRRSSASSRRTATATATGPTSGRSARSEGAFLLCGFWMALAHEPAGRPRHRRALVRAQPRRVRAARPALGGVRRPPAPAARQPPPGLRPRAAARVRRRAALTHRAGRQ